MNSLPFGANEGKETGLMGFDQRMGMLFFFFFFFFSFVLVQIRQNFPHSSFTQVELTVCHTKGKEVTGQEEVGAGIPLHTGSRLIYLITSQL
jgi:hypothetical protein